MLYQTIFDDNFQRNIHITALNFFTTRNVRNLVCQIHCVKNWCEILVRQITPLRPRPHVSGYFWKRNLFLRIGLPSTRKRWNGHRKRNFSKTVSKLQLFENAVFLFSCGRAKGQIEYKLDLLRVIIYCMHACTVNLIQQLSHLTYLSVLEFLYKKIRRKL